MNGVGLLLTLSGLLLAFGLFSLYADRKRDQLRREDRLLQRSMMRTLYPPTAEEIWSDFWDTDDLFSRKVPDAPVMELRPDVREALEDLHRHLNPVT